MSEELGRRAVACKHWRWAPGMLALHPTWQGYRVSHVGLTGMHGVCRWGHFERAVVALPLPASSDVLPDLDDWGTLGCLLGLVRLARMDAHWLPTCLDWEGGLAWVVEPPSRDRQTRHESYASVLVAALEAAP